MTTTRLGLAAAFPPDTLHALEGLLGAMADDELVLGYWDSEWTGIAPMLEEDVAMSSLAQDEIGHARALYALLGELRDEDPDHLAYDRDVADLRHARLLDHPRTDWAFSIARRWLYDEADAVRLEALAGSAFSPLAELVGKIRREEVYHRLHATAWLRRLADADGEPRERLLAAWRTLLPDAATVFTPLDGEQRLVAAGVIAATNGELETRWRQDIGGTCRELGLAVPGPAADPMHGRTTHGEAVAWLWGEATMVRRLDPEATW
ncbi:MAG TPA: 1,2-phenylacetyl-CoA epoxidase subunit PaaC [Candidatus Limnocylindrales bacterium]|jgi:ring-1,2-phenylacetyl-CoA epoxidase subunit PaaC